MHIQKKRDQIYLEDQWKQASHLQTAIVTQGKLLNFSDPNSAENYLLKKKEQRPQRTIGDQQNATWYQYEKDLRNQMKGKPVKIQDPKLNEDFEMSIITEDNAVQSNFEKFSKKPILDQAAEALLQNNTKRREGFSDLPKGFNEAMEAAPGYGLPKIYSKSKRMSQSDVPLVEVLGPNGKELPVATNAQRNILQSYDFGNSLVGQIKMRGQLKKMLQSQKKSRAVNRIRQLDPLSQELVGQQRIKLFSPQNVGNNKLGLSMQNPLQSINTARVSNYQTLQVEDNQYAHSLMPMSPASKPDSSQFKFSNNPSDHASNHAKDISDVAVPYPVTARAKANRPIMFGRNQMNKSPQRANSNSRQLAHHYKQLAHHQTIQSAQYTQVPDQQQSQQDSSRSRSKESGVQRQFNLLQKSVNSSTSNDQKTFTSANKKWTVHNPRKAKGYNDSNRSQHECEGAHSKCHPGFSNKYGYDQNKPKKFMSKVDNHIQSGEGPSPWNQFPAEQKAEPLNKNQTNYHTQGLTKFALNQPSIVRVTEYIIPDGGKQSPRLSPKLISQIHQHHQNKVASNRYDNAIDEEEDSLDQQIPSPSQSPDAQPQQPYQPTITPHRHQLLQELPPANAPVQYGQDNFKQPQQQQYGINRGAAAGLGQFNQQQMLLNNQMPTSMPPSSMFDALESLQNQNSQLQQIDRKNTITSSIQNASPDINQSIDQKNPVFKTAPPKAPELEQNFTFSPQNYSSQIPAQLRQSPQITQPVGFKVEELPKQQQPVHSPRQLPPLEHSASAQPTQGDIRPGIQDLVQKRKHLVNTSQAQVDLIPQPQALYQPNPIQEKQAALPPEDSLFTANMQSSLLDSSSINEPQQQFAPKQFNNINTTAAAPPRAPIVESIPNEPQQHAQKQFNNNTISAAAPPKPIKVENPPELIQQKPIEPIQNIVDNNPRKTLQPISKPLAQPNQVQHDNNQNNLASNSEFINRDIVSVLRNKANEARTSINERNQQEAQQQIESQIDNKPQEPIDFELAESSMFDDKPEDLEVFAPVNAYEPQVAKSIPQVNEQKAVGQELEQVIQEPPQMIQHTPKIIEKEVIVEYTPSFPLAQPPAIDSQIRIMEQNVGNEFQPVQVNQPNITQAAPQAPSPDQGQRSSLAFKPKKSVSFVEPSNDSASSIEQSFQQSFQNNSPPSNNQMPINQAQTLQMPTELRESIPQVSEMPEQYQQVQSSIQQVEPVSSQVKEIIPQQEQQLPYSQPPYTYEKENQQLEEAKRKMQLEQESVRKAKMELEMMKQVQREQGEVQKKQFEEEAARKAQMDYEAQKRSEMEIQDQRRAQQAQQEEFDNQRRAAQAQQDEYEQQRRAQLEDFENQRKAQQDEFENQRAAQQNQLEQQRQALQMEYENQQRAQVKSQQMEQEKYQRQQQIEQEDKQKAYQIEQENQQQAYQLEQEKQKIAHKMEHDLYQRQQQIEQENKQRAFQLEQENKYKAQQQEYENQLRAQQMEYENQRRTQLEQEQQRRAELEQQAQLQAEMEKKEREQKYLEELENLRNQQLQQQQQEQQRLQEIENLKKQQQDMLEQQRLKEIEDLKRRQQLKLAEMLNKSKANQQKQEEQQNSAQKKSQMIINKAQQVDISSNDNIDMSKLEHGSMDVDMFDQAVALKSPVSPGSKGSESKNSGNNSPKNEKILNEPSIDRIGDQLDIRVRQTSVEPPERSNSLLPSGKKAKIKNGRLTFKKVVNKVKILNMGKLHKDSSQGNSSSQHSNNKLHSNSKSSFGGSKISSLSPGKPGKLSIQDLGLGKLKIKDGLGGKIKSMFRGKYIKDAEERAKKKKANRKKSKKHNDESVQQMSQSQFNQLESDPSLVVSIKPPENHDWKETPIYKQFVLKLPEYESLKDTDLVQEMLNQIIEERKQKWLEENPQSEEEDEETPVKKGKKGKKGKGKKGKQQQMQKVSRIPSFKDFDGDNKQLLKEAFDKALKMMIQENEISYVIEMLKSKDEDLGYDPFNIQTRKGYFDRAKQTLEILMAKMGLHPQYKTLIFQYQHQLIDHFEETLFKILYRCRIGHRSIQKCQKIFQLEKQKKVLLGDLDMARAQQGYTEAEENQRKQENIIDKYCQTASREFVQVSQFLDETNFYRGQKFIYSGGDIQKALREEVKLIKEENQDNQKAEIPFMDFNGKLIYFSKELLPNISQPTVQETQENAQASKSQEGEGEDSYYDTEYYDSEYESAQDIKEKQQQENQQEQQQQENNQEQQQENQV